MQRNGSTVAVQVEPLLVDSEVAGRLLGISGRAFRQLCDSGRIGPMPVDLGLRRRLWSVAELRDWIKAGAPPRGRWGGCNGR